MRPQRLLNIASALSTFAIFAALLVVASPSRADVNILTLAEADAELRARTGTGSTFAARTLSCVVRLRAGEVAPPRSGVSNIAPGWAIARGSLDELASLAAAHPEWRFTWAPPRRPLLDKAVPATGAPLFTAKTGATGKGVAIGIVDTGIDLQHPDFRNADGTTRVVWLIDFSRDPIGKHPEVEDQCHDPGDKPGDPCKWPFAAFGAAEINTQLMQGTPRTLPGDKVGHGTHVASLAASNGLSDDPPRYVGMAPEADLFIARYTDPSDPLAFTDEAIIKAVQILFWLAGDYRESQGLAREPIVLNLSLGSDAGPHDDRTSLGATLAAMVGQEFPGRAIVTAAGNSAGLLSGFSAYPKPLGIHTEVDVPEGSAVRLPILTPDITDGMIEGEIFVWADFRKGDAVSIGFDDNSGPWMDPVPPGYMSTDKKDELEVTIANGQKSDLPPQSEPEYERSASIEMTGKWKAGRPFAIRLKGHGTANVWVQSGGKDLSPDKSYGALFPASSKEGTVSIPAAHPDLIAVGATMNRTDWVTRAGQKIDTGLTHATQEVGEVAFFSGGGPNSLGDIKPEIVAPGGFVAGAMGVDDDPCDNPYSIFGEIACPLPDGGLRDGGPSSCPLPDGGPSHEPYDFCLVVDDKHAISAGTSMAAPIVSGAIALVLQQNPGLTQKDIRGLLETSAHAADARQEQQSGAGALDMERLLDALNVMTSGVVREPSSKASRIISGSSYARPDGEWAIRGLVQLRDAAGQIADGFDSKKLKLVAKPAIVLQSLGRAAPGLWRFAVAAPKGTGGEEMTLDVEYAGRSVASKTLPIAVDVSVLRHGFSARGGCAVTSRREDLDVTALLVAAAGCLALRRRR